MTESTKPKSRRGFASMDPARLAEVAASGGAAVKAENRAFAKQPGLANIAGRAGGLAAKKKRDAVSGK